MDSEVFTLYAYLSFLLAFLYIVVYNGKSHIFIEALKQSNNMPCMDMSNRCCLWPSLLSGPLVVSSVDFIVMVVCSLWPFLLCLLLPSFASCLSYD